MFIPKDLEFYSQGNTIEIDKEIEETGTISVPSSNEFDLFEYPPMVAAGR
ncbi:MAG: hypothetical protein LBG45_05605 [Dysgonamonadaceae bacterium]|jgi:hypothetical protein|nr:hypothetical protein [Dysgonamonadaceae bacterium]